jgi:hypothetical protein
LFSGNGHDRWFEPPHLFLQELDVVPRGKGNDPEPIGKFFNDRERRLSDRARGS